MWCTERKVVMLESVIRTKRGSNSSSYLNFCLKLGGGGGLIAHANEKNYKKIKKKKKKKKNSVALVRKRTLTLPTEQSPKLVPIFER
jgi:hypothetical protein